VHGIELQAEQWCHTEIALRDQVAVFSEPQELVRVGPEVERADVDLARRRIGGDALGVAHAVRQDGKLLEAGPFRHSALVGLADASARHHCSRDKTRDQ